MYFTKNSVIFHEGEVGKSFYWILNGEVSVYKNHGAETETCLGVFTDYQYFGEMAIIDSLPRSATAIATKDSEIVEVKVDDIKNMITEHPNILEGFIKTMTQRVRVLNENYVDACKTISEMKDQLNDLTQIKNENLSKKILKYAKEYETLYSQTNKIIRRV